MISTLLLALTISATPPADRCAADLGHADGRADLKREDHMIYEHQDDDRKAEPGQIDRGQLPILTPEQAAKLRADIAEQERILRCLDGLNTDLLRQDAEDC